MGRFRKMAQDDGGETGIDMSPLMDCVFILLIFFIVTTTFVDESGLEVDKSQASAAIQNKENSIIKLILTEKGQVLYENQDIGFGGIQPLVKQMLTNDEVPVIIQADENAQTGLLVRVVDEARLAGAVKVSVGNHRGS